MKKIFVTAPLLCVAFSLEIIAQTPPQPPEPATRTAPSTNPPGPPPCPKIDFQGQPPRTVRDGQPVTFGVTLAGGDPNVTPTIVWNVSAGFIKDGQGTRRIEVDSTGAGVDRQIVADVWIGGYAPECGSQWTATVKIVGHASKVDEFGDLDPEKENERLANVVTAASQSNDNLYIIAYAGRANVRGYANTVLRRIRTQLTTTGIPAQRVGVVDGGFREEPFYEVWIVPEGAEPPRPTPTVDRKEIVYPTLTPTRSTQTRGTPVKKP
jgi:hypothetical protein